MKRNVILIIVSLLSILFMTFHLTDDIVRGMEPGTLSNLTAVPILVVWLYGTLVLAERRSGYVILLLGSTDARLRQQKYNVKLSRLGRSALTTWRVVGARASLPLAVVTRGRSNRIDRIAYRVEPRLAVV